jgi:putative Mg2+ transporter-C (MgtC) family protein
MPQHLEWTDIALRLAVTMFASAAIGLDRSERGRQVGLRTTMLVCLAAAIAMILVNLLLPMTGKAATSYVTLDLMRLPLGILSGMGFIGAGAIVRRGDLVQGVTTAATLWYVTVMGLCLGAGRFDLGLAALVLGIFVLWCLRWAERYIGIPHRASLLVAFDTGFPIEHEVKAALAAAGFAVGRQSLSFTRQGHCCEIRYDLHWRDSGGSPRVPDFTSAIARRDGVRKLEWQPRDAG